MGKGKILRWVSAALIIAMLCASIVFFPGVDENKPAEAAGGPYWADCYGFNRSINTWGASYYRGWYFSGTEHLWNNTVFPSYRTCLAWKAWPSTGYLNANVFYANMYLSGNAFFLFDGHGHNHCLEFEDATYDSSYLVDRHAFSYGNPQVWINDSWCQMDDMLFAGLISCRSTAGNNQWGSIGAWWRCRKYTDVVLGFNDSFTVGEGKCFTMQFCRYAIAQNKTCGWARNQAIQDTLNNAQGLIDGVQSAEIWSRDWNPLYPNYSWIKLGTPRSGQPG